MRYGFLDLIVDLDRRRVSRKGSELDITGLSFDLLACLLQRDDRLVTFDELMAAVWAPAVVSEETVTQRVKLLRQALGDDGRQQQYIRSVRGRGYQLCAKPRALPSRASPGRALPSRALQSEQSASSNDSMSPARRTWMIGGVLAFSALLIAAGWWLASRPERDAGRRTAQAQLLERAHYYYSIGQRDNNERAIGLYAQVLRQDPHNIAALLGLSFAYSARVCLYSFPSTWAERAESLARTVIRAEPRNSLAESALGYSADCRGQVDGAIVGYERALALAPAERTDSLASLANLYHVKGRLVDALRTDLQLMDAAHPPRFLDVQIAGTLELLGFLAAAEDRFQNSFQLYPDNVFSNIAYPRFLMVRGRLVEAQSRLDEAFTRGTEHRQLHLLAGELQLLRGEREAAVQSFERASRLQPNDSLAGTLARLYASPPPSKEWALQRIAGVRKAIESGDHWPTNWLELALLEQATGDMTSALAALNRAVESGFLDADYLQISPLFQPFARQPAFAQLIADIHQRVAAQREVVLAADWAPRTVLFATAALSR